MGFEPQIRMIVQNIRKDRQTVLFSATFPKQIEKLAKSILKLPLEIIVGERSAINKDITQYAELHDEGDKFVRLLQLLGIWYTRGNVLIFVDTQDKCDQLFHDLLKAGYPCLSLHGGKDQVDRDFTLHEFKTCVKTVMVATSVAGRGLDVPEIVCVINYNCPNHFEDYVHRVGRTGRAGRKGTAYTFISSQEEQFANILVRALTAAGGPESVPKEIQRLADSFRTKVERGEAQWSSSGFVGKGFTFDTDEMNEAQRLVSMQKREYAIEQGLLNADGTADAEDVFEDDDEAEAPGADKTTAKPSDGSAEMVSSKEAAVVANTTALPPANDTQSALMRARQLAMHMAAAANVKAMVAASQTYAPDGTPYDVIFTEELEFNDYPPQVRALLWSFSPL